MNLGPGRDLYDDDFLHALKARAPDAQRTFWRQEMPRVRRACESLLRDPAAAEETAVDVLDDFLFVHVDHVRRGSALQGYLRGWVLTACRRTRRTRDRLAGEGPEPHSAPPSRELPQRIEALHFAIDQLSTQQRRALRMRYFLDLDNADIALQLGVSRPRVTQLLARGLARVRERLGEEGDP